jgi:malonate-semialdehyde dehydrogenase (acetylating)/methylmalonate-semialdehyde dehydrogenase
MQKVIEHYINGKTDTFSSTNYHDVFNPATGKVTAKVVMADEALVNDVVEIAKTAFLTWSKQSPIKRARIFYKYVQLLNENINELAEIVSHEHGKTFADAIGSIQRGIEVVEHYCGIANLLQGTFSNNVSTNIDAYTIRQPLGVCAGVSPFNFPVMVPVWLFMPAIACGNTFILKPSEKVPTAAVYLAKLFSQAGLPDGVLNIVHGHKPAVDALLMHQDVKAVSAVGSTPVAEYIYKIATQNNKRSNTFGGAKNHCIIMPDVDIDSVADAVSGAAFGAAGERCMALSVAVIVGNRKRHDDIVNKLKAKASAIKLGLGTHKNSEMGPLITREHLNKVLGYIETGVSEGANLVLDGRKIKVDGCEQGFFLGANIFIDVKPHMRIYKEEIFGPVLTVLHVDTYEEALELTNNHEFGNGASIFTNDMNIARSYVNEVQAGMIGVNVPIPVPFVTHSFGGWKNSVFGDISLHATESVRFYTKSKSITVANAKISLSDKINTSSLIMPTHD